MVGLAEVTTGLRLMLEGVNKVKVGRCDWNGSVAPKHHCLFDTSEQDKFHGWNKFGKHDVDRTLCLNWFSNWTLEWASSMLRDKWLCMFSLIKYQESNLEMCIETCS